jgi:hypothetical protein
VVCTQKISESRNQFGIQVAWEYVKDKEYFDLLLYIDGDYLDMYIDNTSRKFGTLVRVKDEFIKQFLSLMTLPAAEQRGSVVLQGMDIMRVHTPSKQIVAGSKSPQRGGVWTRLRIKTNTCDLTSVIWPRRADGSMDYPPPQLTQVVPGQPEVVTTPPAEYDDVVTVTPEWETVTQEPGMALPLIIALR